MSDEAREEVVERGWLDRVTRSVQSEVAHWPSSHRALVGSFSCTSNEQNMSTPRRSTALPQADRPRLRS